MPERHETGFDGRGYLDELSRIFRSYRSLAERALAQVPGARWHAEPAPGSNSLAIIVKHVAGNLRSRWTDFLTTDGEKPDRNRDREFETGPREDEAGLRASWNAGWDALLTTLDGLSPADLGRTVAIRGEAHSVLQAAQRSLAHTAQHVGQIVYVAKLLSGDDWKTLSIPRGGSAEFNRAPKPYGEKP